MARGGYRTGAGRPRKDGSTTESPAKIQREAKSAGLSPLEYMLEVMNSELADDGRRDRMAIAAAPFVHPRAAEAEPGKREKQQASAEKAVAGGGKFAPAVAPKLAVDNTR